MVDITYTVMYAYTSAIDRKKKILLIYSKYGVAYCVKKNFGCRVHRIGFPGTLLFSISHRTNKKYHSTPWRMTSIEHRVLYRYELYFIYCYALEKKNITPPHVAPYSVLESKYSYTLALPLCLSWGKFFNDAQTLQKKCISSWADGL